MTPSVHELLLLSQSRGTDAAGVAVIRRDSTFRLFKRPGPAGRLVADKLYWQVLDLDNKVMIILGHTRQKTRGSERNNRNNHPIVFCRRLCATHNGHLSNADQLARELRLPRTAEVDSEVLFRLIDRSRDDREFRSLLARCRGRISAAFVRLAEPDRLRLLKGDMPLHAAHVPRLRSVFYASEAWMLRAALDGHRHETLNLDPFTLSPFDADDLLDFRQTDVAFITPEVQRWLRKSDTCSSTAPSSGVGKPRAVLRGGADHRTRLDPRAPLPPLRRLPRHGRAPGANVSPRARVNQLTAESARKGVPHRRGLDITRMAG